MADFEFENSCLDIGRYNRMIVDHIRKFIIHGRWFIMLALWLPIAIVSNYIQFTLPLHGEKIASIPCVTFVLPLAAAFVPGMRSLAIVLSGWLCLHAGAPLPLTMGVPTLMAALSWQLSRSSGWKGNLFHVAIPIGAMITFIACSHTAWAYTLYWLIPIACLFMPRNAITRALQSTFIAHAAGSVIWAYNLPLTGTEWLSLMPIVAVERLLVTAMSAGLLAAMALADEMIKEHALDHRAAKALSNRQGTSECPSSRLENWGENPLMRSIEVKPSFLILCLLITSVGHATHYIHPLIDKGQEEFYISGGLAVVSEKCNSLIFYNTRSEIKNRRGSFFFSLHNKSDKSIQFSPEKIMVTDQLGRSIRIVPKEELLATQHSKHRWQMIATTIQLNTDSNSIGCGITWNIAGGTRHTEPTHNTSHYDASTIHCDARTSHSDALSNMVIRQAEDRASAKEQTIAARYDDLVYRLNNFYVDRNTVLPGALYSANVEIEVPEEMDKELTYLFITFDMDDESHTFCYHCHDD